MTIDTTNMCSHLQRKLFAEEVFVVFFVFYTFFGN